MKAIKIPVSNNDKLSLIELELNELQTYHKEIGCDYVDFCVLWSNTSYSIDAVIDDSGAINGKLENERFSNSRSSYKFYGNVIITMTDRNSGETVDIDFELVRYILINVYGFKESDFYNLIK